MRIVVTGSRFGDDYALVDWALYKVHKKHGITCLINGLATGYDTISRRWALDNGVPVQDFPADWGAYKKRAGPIRNQQMIDEGKPDAAVAFPGGDGTADMVRRLERRGIPIWDLRQR